MATDATAWTVVEVREWEEEQWPGGEVAERLAGTVYRLLQVHVHMCTLSLTWFHVLPNRLHTFR